MPPARRPFWIPASSFYFLAAAIALGFFFLVWGILHDGEEPTPWIPAGLGASVVLIGAVVLREIVLRRTRRRFLLAQKQLDDNLRQLSFRPGPARSVKKLSIERNAEIIRQIQKKSDAAKVLMRLADGHLEVAEVCDEYLKINQRELQLAGAGSPRLAALRRGHEIVAALHKFHLLAWAEIETHNFTQAAKNRVTIAEKTETAQKALNVLETALNAYPSERRLVESKEAVREFMVSIKIAHLVEEAERAVFKGNHKRALSSYRDALFLLSRENAAKEEIKLISEKINGEIEKLKAIAPRSKKLKRPDKEQGND